MDFFFGTAFVAGGAPVTALVADRSAPGAPSGAAGGGLVTCCAIRLLESTAQRIIQQFSFIAQDSRDLISGSVNVRHFPWRSSPSLILPIWTRRNPLTARPCDSKRRRTSRYLPSANSSSTSLVDRLEESTRAFSALKCSPSYHTPLVNRPSISSSTRPSTVATYFLRIPYRGCVRCRLNSPSLVRKMSPSLLKSRRPTECRCPHSFGNSS